MTVKSFFWALAFICACIIAAGSAFIWSGVYNVGADVPHWAATFWILEKTRNRSIAFHSMGVHPPSLSDKQDVHKAFPYFHEACRHCHGAPGFARNKFAQGLYPNPPPLSLEKVQKHLDNAAMFWVVKNGIKMTGMPAFEKIHNDDQIWSIIAFVRDLPHIYPSNYRDMLKAARKKGELGNNGQP